MIESELSNIGIFRILITKGLTTGLIETLQDKNIYVRRRAIAALGEYLFYAAT
jgi:hypothetical protein